MSKYQDTFFREHQLVIRDITASAFLTQGSYAPEHPGVLLRVDGASIYQWNGSSWVAFVAASTNLTGGIESLGSGASQIVVQNVINVRSFGAKGDGATDDAVAITAAIQEAASGQIVFFPAGTYCVGSQGVNVVSKTNVVLLAERGAVIKATAQSALVVQSLGRATLRLSSCVGVKVTGFKFNGNLQVCAAIGLDLCTDCVVEDNEIYATNQNGAVISTGGVRNSYVGNVVRDGAGTCRGIWLGGLSSSEMEIDINVKGNFVTRMIATGIVCNSIGGFVSDNTCKTNEGSGIIFPGGNGYSAKNIICSGNRCEDNLFYGIQCDITYTSDLDLSSNIVVTGNNCSGNIRGVGSGGIYAVNSVGWSITNNTCVNNLYSGIHAGDRAFDIVISGNICLDTRAGGARTQVRGIVAIAQAANNHNVTITGNTCRNNTSNGIEVQAAGGFVLSYVNISNNSCYANSSRGIHVVEQSAGDMVGLVVCGNISTGNTADDLRVSVRDAVINSNRAAALHTSIATFALDLNSTTPTVNGRSYWNASNSAGTSITNFVGQDGQRIDIRATNANTTINNTGTIVNKGAANILIPSDGIISYIRQAGVWREVSRSF